MKKNTFKLRAENYLDIEMFLNMLLKKNELKQFEVRGIDGEDYSFPDRELTFKVKSFTITEVRDTLSQIEDGHVMLQTVEEIQNYTGERNPEYHFDFVGMSKKEMYEQTIESITASLKNPGLSHMHDILAAELQIWKEKLAKLDNES